MAITGVQVKRIRPKRIRKPPKTDPTKAGRLILQYEAVLKRHVSTYNALVKRSVLIASGERLLESPISHYQENLLISSVTQIGNIVAEGAKADIDEHAVLSYQHGREFAKKTIVFPTGQTLTTGISFDLPVAQATMNRLAMQQNAAFKGVTDEMSKRTIAELTEGIQRGESIPQLTARIEDIYQNVGVGRAEAIARTETMKAVNQGALDEYKKDGFVKVQWLAAMDERTCTRHIPGPWVQYAGCGDLNYKKFNINEVPPLPFHVNCRCTTVPILEGMEGMT